MASDETQRVEAIENGLDMGNMDVQNMTALVGAYSDANGLNAARLKAIKEMMLRMDRNDNAESVDIEGIRLLIKGCKWNTNYDEPMYCVDESTFRLYGGHSVCNVFTISIDKVFCGTYTQMRMVAKGDYGVLAQKIIDLCLNRRICRFCDNIFDGIKENLTLMEGFNICRYCAVKESGLTCTFCHHKRGVVRHVAEHSADEHSACGRRSRNAE